MFEGFLEILIYFFLVLIGSGLSVVLLVACVWDLFCKLRSIGVEIIDCALSSRRSRSMGGDGFPSILFRKSFFTHKKSDKTFTMKKVSSRRMLREIAAGSREATKIWRLCEEPLLAEYQSIGCLSIFGLVQNKRFFRETLVGFVLLEHFPCGRLLGSKPSYSRLLGAKVNTELAGFGLEVQMIKTVVRESPLPVLLPSEQVGILNGDTGIDLGLEEVPLSIVSGNSETHYHLKVLIR